MTMEREFIHDFGQKAGSGLGVFHHSVTLARCRQHDDAKVCGFYVRWVRAVPGVCSTGLAWDVHAPGHCGHRCRAAQVDLTARLREILVNYPEGTSIIKELVQASQLCRLRRQHESPQTPYCTVNFAVPAECRRRQGRNGCFLSGQAHPCIGCVADGDAQHSDVAESSLHASPRAAGRASHVMWRVCQPCKTTQRAGIPRTKAACVLCPHCACQILFYPRSLRPSKGLLCWCSTMQSSQRLTLTPSAGLGTAASAGRPAKQVGEPLFMFPARRSVGLFGGPGSWRMV